MSSSLPSSCSVAVDEPGAVAVVDVAVPVDDRERLDRLAVELPPAVDRQPLGLLEDSRREDDVFLDADDEQAERLAGALLFDDLVMLQERGDGFALLGQRMRREVDFAGRVDRVDHLSRRQRAAEAVGDLLGGLRRHRHADEVVVAADGEVIGHDFDRGNALLALGRLAAEFHDFELAEELGEVAAGDFAEDGGLAVGEAEPGEAFDELGAADMALLGRGGS